VNKALAHKNLRGLTTLLSHPEAHENLCGWIYKPVRSGCLRTALESRPHRSVFVLFGTAIDVPGDRRLVYHHIQHAARISIDPFRG
jgi:hypothetical protein